MNKKVLKRIIITLPAVVLQIIWFVILGKWLSPYATFISVILELLAFIYVLYILISVSEGAYKMLWLILILSFPVMGGLLYMFFGDKHSGKRFRQMLNKSREELNVEKEETDFSIKDKRLESTIKLLEKESGFPIYPIEKVKYYPLGEEMWKDMLADLKKAKKTIYLEYFIVENGLMWDSMVEIMEKKVLDGVDVRLMYDDLGSFATYNIDNIKELSDKGIKCFPFNPLMVLKGTLNYRDHRKMLIIDNEIAYSGGVNLADEYINKTVKYGHWKDIGFRITGLPVNNFSLMFAQFNNAFAAKEHRIEYLKNNIQEPSTNKGYAISYYDSPVGKYAISNNFYVELLNQAKDYVYFYTPYLMLGNELMNAMIRAAMRGVDVRIIMPGIPDKKLVYRMSRSYYPPLIEAGVKIYEYTPGFVHAKACIMDDVVCTIGTVNLDYRSLFLHFENNTLFYKSAIIKDLKADFLKTQEMCNERNSQNIKSGFIKFVVDGILRVFAPLC